VRRRVSKYFPESKRKPDPAGCALRPAPAGTSIVVKVAGSRRDGDWLMREYRLIRRLRPRDNRVLYGGSMRPKDRPVRILRCLGCEAGHTNIHDVMDCERPYWAGKEWR
jgi:hypothetical protein